MPKRSPLALAVLAALFEKPMHPYLMQRLIKERGKERVINVGQRATLYKTIDRLRRDGLIDVRETTREAQRPERTVYEITDAGRETALAWTREMLSAPRPEFPEFPAAVSFLSMLEPADALRQLEIRKERLEQSLADQDAESAKAPPGLPRLFLLEDEYVRALTAAELTWVDEVVTDLRAGRLTWSAEWIAEIAAKMEGPQQ